MNFIKLLVKNKDEKYLRSLFQEDLIISNQLINELIEDDLELFFEIIYILSGGLLDLKSDEYSLLFKDQKFKSIIVQKILEHLNHVHAEGRSDNAPERTHSREDEDKGAAKTGN